MFQSSALWDFAGLLAERVEVPRMSFNLAVILRETAQAAPDRPALVFEGGGLTYAELE